MEQNRDNIVYDIDKNIIKRNAPPTLQLRKASTPFLTNNDTTII